MRHGRRLHSWREHLCWTRSSSRASGERPSQCPAKGGGQVRFYRLLLVTPTLLAVNLGHLHTCNICSIVVVLHTITRIQWNPIDRTTPGWVEEDQKTLFSTHKLSLTIYVHHYARRSIDLVQAVAYCVAANTVILVTPCSSLRTRFARDYEQVGKSVVWLDLWADLFCKGSTYVL